MTPAQRLAALGLEADRIKARLDNLERYLAGHPDAWVDIVARMPAEVAEVVIDKALAEARQQALALVSVTKAIAALADEEKAPTGPDPADEVKRKREEKRAAARSAIV